MQEVIQAAYSAFYSGLHAALFLSAALVFAAGLFTLVHVRQSRPVADDQDGAGRVMRILGIVLAGAGGGRLAPLTADRAKSAVPFGGLYRLVDFTLSNLVNGGLQRIAVLTQYKSHSLNRHITTTWRLNSLLDNYVIPVPAQQRLGPRWQAGWPMPSTSR